MLSLWHFSLEMPVISCAKVRRFSTKNKQNTELFALTASFLMLVNTPWSSFSIVNTGIQKVAWNRGHTPSVLLKDRNGKTVWFIMLLTIFSIKNCPRDWYLCFLYLVYYCDDFFVATITSTWILYVSNRNVRKCSLESPWFQCQM